MKLKNIVVVLICLSIMTGCAANGSVQGSGTGSEGAGKVRIGVPF